MLAVTRGVMTLAMSFILTAAGTIASGTLFSQDSPYFEEGVLLIPPPLPAGSDLSQIFADWSIRLGTERERAPISGTRSLFFCCEGPRVKAPAIFSAAPDTEDTGALVIEFSSPVRRVSLYLGAGSSVTAALRFFDAAGVMLGEQTTELPGAYVIYSPILVKDEAGRAISRIDVLYSDPKEPETLFILKADFEAPPAFRKCVAQVAHGTLSGGERTLQTQLSMTSSAVTWSPMHTIANLSLEFRDESGAPLPVILDGQQDSGFDYVLEDVESKIVRTTSSVSDLDRGCACVTSNYPFELAAIYRILDSDGKVASEAGIQGSVPGYRFFGIFQKNLAEEASTGLALANVSNQQATISITFYLPLFKKYEAEMVMSPGEQKALFVEEIVAELEGQDAQGTMEIVSDQRIVGTIVRTIKGVVSASLPLGRSRTPDMN